MPNSYQNAFQKEVMLTFKGLLKSVVLQLPTNK